MIRNTKMFMNTRLLCYSKKVTIITISYPFQIKFRSCLPIQDIVCSGFEVDLCFPNILPTG